MSETESLFIIWLKEKVVLCCPNGESRQEYTIVHVDTIAIF